MDTMTAFLKGMAAQSNPMKVFDWEMAAKLIAEKRPTEASAGLIEDWPFTGGLIWQDGCPVAREDTYVYLASTWATPTLVIDGDTVPCFTMESDAHGWNSGTYWPKSALDIVGAAVPQPEN